MKPLMDFAFRLGAKLALNPNYIVKKDNRYFLLDENLKKLIRKDFYHVGIYLGKIKNGKFFPSFNFLAMLAKGKANKVVVDRKAAWLFICGRDIFKKGIVAVYGAWRKGDYALVLNEFGECLGFGKITRNFDVEKTQVTVENILDIGDFLRRES